jgi:hypothetical protein
MMNGVNIAKRLKKRPLLRAFVALVLSFGLVATIYLTKNFVLNSSKAAAIVTLFFSPNPVNVPTNGSADLSVNVTTPVKISFAKVTIPLPPCISSSSCSPQNYYKVTKITPSSALRNIIQISTVEQANKDGKVVVTLGQKPGDAPAPIGTYELVRISLAKSVITDPFRFSVSVDTSSGNTQIVDSNAQQVYVSKSSGAIAGLVVTTPTVKITPTVKPRATSTPTRIPTGACAAPGASCSNAPGGRRCCEGACGLNLRCSQ